MGFFLGWSCRVRICRLVEVCSLNNAEMLRCL